MTGYRLAFSHEGLIPIEPAFANLEPDPDAVVHGVLHLLGTGQLEHLDRIEGAEYRHVDVVARGDDAGAVPARTYVDPDPVQGLRPSRRYLRSCCDGAREHGLPDGWVEELASHPSLHIPVVSDVANLFVGLAERLRRAGLRPELRRMRRRAQSGDDAAASRFDDDGRFTR